MYHRFITRHARAPHFHAVSLEFFTLRNAIIIGVFTVALGAAYAIQMSDAGSKGYVIRQLEQEIGALREGAAKTEVKLVADQSVRNVEQKVKEMGMVPTTQVEYVATGAPVAMAAR